MAFARIEGTQPFVLAVLGMLSLLGWRWGWIYPLPAMIIGTLASLSLYYTQVRGGGLALIVAVIYLLWRSGSEAVKQRARRYGTGLCLASCLVFAVAILGSENLEHFCSGRLHLWQLSLSGIAARPLWGWGFDGFGIAYRFIADWAGSHGDTC